MSKTKEFRKRGLSAVAAALIAAVSFVPADLSFAPLSANAGQQLGQTDFDEGAGLPWHIVESAPAQMDFELTDGVYKVRIIEPGGASQGGEDRWDCQFRHRGLKIVSGHKYKVSYEITSTKSGQYYTKIGDSDKLEVWHNNMDDNGPDLGGSWDCIHIGENETQKVTHTFTASQSVDVAEWAFHLGGDGQYTPGGCFPAGTEITFDNMSLIDLDSDENDYVQPEKWERSDILVNQMGYLTDRAKRATLVSSEKSGVDFDILDEDGDSVYSGTSEYIGKDEDSGDTVHLIDFSDFDKTGVFHIETEDGEVSQDFTVDDKLLYSGLLYNSLNYFYQNRSGIDIESRYITSGDKSALARAAGHPTDSAEILSGWDSLDGTGKSIDVTGGWYDAGDHGKYVVNGGFSLWMMQNQYETALKYGFDDAYADGSMSIPENGNKAPDLLDEARWEMDWMLKMIVQDGEYKGMSYHKAHDEKWTGLAIAPADDELRRIVKPPSTAATLNLAACAAQASRLWYKYDEDFADECLEAAEAAYEAAKAHPDMYAPLDSASGGGAYGDTDVEDEFYWAACELFLTTGDDSYYEDMKDSDFFLELPTTLSGGESVDTIGSFDWGNTAALGTLSLFLNNGGSLSSDDIGTITDNICSAADHYIDMENEQGYGLPYGPSTLSYNDKDKGYLWGSNSFVADNSIVIAYAFLSSDDDKYMDGVLGGMDYLLGRNAMEYSYVTGYGYHAVEHPHHRYWSNQVDPTFPSAPAGVMSGGPNSGMQDPWVKGSGWKKGEIAPQKCYMDHIEAWSVNECTINWNASIAWLSGFTAAENGGIDIGSAGTYSDPDAKADLTPSDQPEKPSKDKDDDEEETTEATTKRASAKTEKTARTTEKASEKSSKDDDKGDLAKVALISAAVVAGLVSVELFVYKMAKLKKK